MFSAVKEKEKEDEEDEDEFLLHGVGTASRSQHYTRLQYEVLQTLAAGVDTILVVCAAAVRIERTTASGAGQFACLAVWSFVLAAGVAWDIVREDVVREDVVRGNGWKGIGEGRT